ncbi:ABC transporter permease [Glycomyces tenuis]|uniref:ABC transporter permease n=1 Tax=Glycomyces tenuis TaxID=58116 RepID=UPI000414BF8C|nr:ABC transporter permease [Glycomyces tenuis]
MNATTQHAPLWWTLGIAESRLIARNRTVLITAAVLPLLIGFALSRSDDRLLAGGVGAVAAIQMGFVQMFGVFFAVTMTLASRRQQRYLKRLRTSPASTASVVAGLAAPSVALSLMQTLILLVFLGWQTGTVPSRPDLLALAFVIGTVLNAALGFLTASFTKNPEAAQVTVIPGMLALMIGIGWTLMQEPGGVGLAHLLVPAGAVTDLTRTAWDGTAGRGFAEAVALPGGAALAVAAAACVVAVKLFRWQPRA